MNASKKTETPHLSKFDSACDLLDACRHVLMTHEITNGLMLGILEKNKARERNEDDIYWTVSTHDEMLVMVMSGLYIILYGTSTDPSLYRPAIRELIEKDIAFPGIIGPRPTANTFRSVYERMTGKPMTLKMNQRIYQATSSTYRKREDLFLACATENDLPLLQDWMKRFYLDIGEHAKPAQIEERLRDKLENKTLYLLRHNDTPVSMVGKERPFKDIITVSYVFTPPSLRRRGYATTSVGMFTEMLLESYRIVTLYTDLSNPTSNDIYQRIGYVPVTDSVVYLT